VREKMGMCVVVCDGDDGGGRPGQRAFDSLSSRVCVIFSVYCVVFLSLCVCLFIVSE